MVASALNYILGKQRVYLSGLLLFALGSLGSALAPDFTVRMCFRVLQGIGAAALLALGPALLRDIYPPTRLGRALALNALVVAGGLAAGPSLGGVVLFFADWRWIFALNLPLGLVAAWLTVTSFTTESVSRRQFDWQGALCSAAVMATLMLALENIPVLIIGSFWCGLGYGFFQAPNNHEIMANAPVLLSSTVSGVLATVRTLGQSLGSATFALAWSFQSGRVDLTLWVAFAATLVALVSSAARLTQVRGMSLAPVASATNEQFPKKPT